MRVNVIGLSRASVLVFLRDLHRFPGTMGAVGKFRYPLTV